MSDLQNDKEATVTIDNVAYPVSSLSSKVTELISLYSDAERSLIGARRAAAIQEIAVNSLSDMILAAHKEDLASDADAA